MLLLRQCWITIYISKFVWPRKSGNCLYNSLQWTQGDKRPMKLWLWAKTLVRKRTFTSTNQFYLANSSSLLVPQHECFFARRKSIKPRATEAGKRCVRGVVLMMRLKPRQTSALLVPNLPTGRVNARSTALIGSVIDDDGDAVDNVG